ncbi:MAG TPA: MAPEG family protein [Sphingomicrobium sp.]|nr:MAPEG family protein [Sphingomicrobium sp.]
MDYSPILAPVVALVAWTLLMMLWMMIARFGQFRRMGVTLGSLPRGARGPDLDGRPDAAEAQWKSHNYNHLMEQPTIFYAIALTLALMGFGGGINYWLAWSYVGLRILHSIVQATINIVVVRFTIFSLSTLCLLGLTVHAGARILHDCGLIG